MPLQLVVLALLFIVCYMVAIVGRKFGEMNKVDVRANSEILAVFF